VLLLGGYGTFGRRMAPRLAAEGFEVLVAGRSLAKAEEYCAGRAGLTPLALDRNRERDLAAALAAYRPFAVIDASGPFQGMDYSIVRAAIAAGCHYLDIADARDFVCGIGALDGEARAAGVAAIAGGSTVPALSGAVARRLAGGMDEVRAVEMILSATSLGTSGRSITKVALSYLGRPIAIWRGRRWTRGYGAQELRRQDFDVKGTRPLRGRLAGLADVPDLSLLPDRLPGRPAVLFRAGTDLGLHNLGLWLLSWPVRWRWIGRPESLGRLLSACQRLTAWAGSSRSAMTIRLFGTSGARRLELRWTVIADRDDGPHIPTLTVPILLGKLARGEVAAGARDSGTLLDIDDYRASFAALAIAEEIVEVDHPPALYERVMGRGFAVLPPAVQALHQIFRDGGASGRAEVSRGANPFARLVAWLGGFPAAGEHDLHVAFEERDGVERWTRDFSGRCFSSRLSQWRELLIERFGILAFGFELPTGDSGLEMVMRRWWLGPLPMPMALAPRAPAREWQDEEGRFRFDVRIGLPLIGPVVHYRGWLVGGASR
jgi:hypothetical protein